MAKRACLYGKKWFTPILGVVALLCAVGRADAQKDRDSLICRLQTRLEDAANLAKYKENTPLIDTLTPLLAEFPKGADPAFQWLEAEYRFHIGYAAFYRSYVSPSESDNLLCLSNLKQCDSLAKALTSKGSDVLARSLRMQGMYEYFMEENALEAQKFYDEAYRNWMEVPSKDSVEFAVLIQCMGQAAGKMGEYERAIELCQQSLEIRKRIFGERHQRVGVAYWNLGNALGYSDRFDEATKAYKAALDILLVADPDNYSLIADIQMNLATNYAQLGLLEEAVANHESSLQLQKKISGPDSPHLVDRLANIALVYHELGDHRRAMSMLDEADRICQINQLSKGPEIAAVKYHRALLLEKDKGASPAIIQNFREALAAISTFTSSDEDFALPKPNATLEPLLMQQIVLAFSQHLGTRNVDPAERLKALEAGLQGYELAAQLADRLRIEYQNQEDKLFISGKGSAYLSNALDICQKLYSETRDTNYAARALRLMESCKSQLVLEFYKKSQALGTSGLGTKQLAIYDSLLRRSIELEYQSQVPGIGSVPQKALRDELTHTQLTLRDLQSTFERNSSGFASMQANQRKVNLSDIRSRLIPGTTFINYTLTDKQLFVLAQDQQQLKMRSATLDSAFWGNLREWKLRCQSPIEGKADVRRFGNLGFNLYSTLLRPEIEGFKENDKLIIIADGELCNLQFEALVVESNTAEKQSLPNMPFLVKSHQCQYAPSATMWLLQQSKPSVSSSQKCLGLGWGPMPSYIPAVGEAPLPGLPGTKEEIEAVRELVLGHYRVGKDASEAAFKQVASEYGILHLALHASANGSSPEIMFPEGGSESEDGVLHFHEIFPLKLRARLAVLSACESGTGQLLEGEGIQSMSSGFAAVGIPTLLMTLWEVSDESGKEIVVEFYKGISKGLPVDRALREAKLSYLDKANGHRASPYFWAAYLASGNMEPIQLASPNAPIWPWAIGGTFILVCIFITYRIYKKNRNSL